MTDKALHDFLTGNIADAPDWANWAAVDGTGSLYWYESHPQIWKPVGVWTPTDRTKLIRADVFLVVSDWTQTLTDLAPYRAAHRAKLAAEDQAKERERQLYEALERASAALDPLACAVFNDNGDITVTSPAIREEHCRAAYYAKRAAEQIMRDASHPKSTTANPTAEDLRRIADDIESGKLHPQRLAVIMCDAMAIVSIRSRDTSPLDLIGLCTAAIGEVQDMLRGRK